MQVLQILPEILQMLVTIKLTFIIQIIIKLLKIFTQRVTWFSTKLWVNHSSLISKTNHNKSSLTNLLCKWTETSQAILLLQLKCLPLILNLKMNLTQTILVAMCFHNQIVLLSLSSQNLLTRDSFKKMTFRVIKKISLQLTLYHFKTDYTACQIIQMHVIILLRTLLWYKTFKYNQDHLWWTKMKV